MITQKDEKYNLFKKQNNAELIAKGLDTIPDNWALTPLRAKKPYRQNWQNEQPLSKSEIAKGIKEGNEQISKKGKPYKAFDSGFGLRTGDISNGLLAIDCDGFSGAMLCTKIKGYSTLPLTVSWTSTKQGREQRLFLIPDKYREQFKDFNRLAVSELGNFKCADGEQLEFRYNGCQSVLPPSYHPETGGYKWIKSPNEIAIAELPQFLIDFLLQTNNENTVNTMTPYDNYLNDLTLPINVEIPLDVCIAPKTRDSLLGTGQGERDNTGAMIARDLIGTASYLDSIGQNYTQSPYELLTNFCRQCSPPLNNKDCERIYSSAVKSNPKPSLDPDKINSCIASWYWKNSDIKQVYCQSKKETTQTKVKQEKATLDKWEAIRQAKEILLNNNDEIATNILLEDLRKQTDISEYSWDNKFIKPLRREIKEQKLRLEIAVYLAEADRFKQVQIKQKICSNYSLNNFDFQTLVECLESEHKTPEKTVFSFTEFMQLAVKQEDWIIPSILPVGEMLMLTALPKVGKTLLANDLAYAVLTGTEVLGEKAHQGKVLYIGSDETPGSLMRRFQSRGFDLVENPENFRVMTHLDLSNMGELEGQLEDFKPDLVVIDSLTSITLNIGISEKDSEFARYLYRLKDLLKKYNSASILIHHENKNNEARGICKVSGSARIPAAVWGIAQLSGGDTLSDNPDSDLVKGQNIRWLDLQPREGEKLKFTLEINPKEIWSSKGIFDFLGEADDPNGAKKSQCELVLELLRVTSKKLEYQEINEHLVIGQSLYKVLDRLCDRHLINRERSKNNPRRWVYFVDSHSQEEKCNEILTEDENHLPPLPPSPIPEVVQSNSITIDNNGLEVTGHFTGQLLDTTNLSNSDLDTSNQEESTDSVQLDTQPDKRGGGGSSDPEKLENDDDTNCDSTEVIECPSDFTEIFKQNSDRLIAMGKDSLPKRLQWYQSFWGVNISSPKDFYNQSLVTDEMIVRSWHELRLLEIKNQ